MIAATGAWSGAAATALGVVLTALVGFIAYVLREARADMRREMAELKGEIRTAGRHLDSLANTAWIENIRVTGVEDFLAATSDFRPVRLVGTAETQPRGRPGR